MKPLLVLLASFAASMLGLRVVTQEWDYILAGNLAMTAMLLFTASGHFAFTKGMMLMLPEMVPFKKALVYLTGVLEVAAAIGLLIGPWRETTALLLMGFFVLLLPANIYAAIRHVDYQAGTHQGQDVRYLWFRVPLQLFFIAWVGYFSA